MEVLSMAGLPTYILQRDKAELYPPIRGAFSETKKFTSFAENV